MMWCPRCQKNVDVSEDRTVRDDPPKKKRFVQIQYRCQACNASLGSDTKEEELGEGNACGE